MYLSDLKGFISGLAVVTTILQFLSGILVCKQYVITKTTGEASLLPFLCGVVSAGLWLLYGLTKKDNNVIFVNTVGLTLMVAYTAVFYIFTFKKSAVMKQILLGVMFLAFIIGYTSTENDKLLLLDRLGLLACSLTLVAIAAPMSKLLHVVKVRNTECLPFPMILMSFFVCTLWLLYGIIEEDTYMTVPNFIGAALAMLQLSLFVIYPNLPQTPSTLPSKTVLA